MELIKVSHFCKSLDRPVEEENGNITALLSAKSNQGLWDKKLATKSTALSRYYASK